MEQNQILILALLLGFLLDSKFGDPEHFPHPIVIFGDVISWLEKYLNKGSFLTLKGLLMSCFLISSIYIFATVAIILTYESHWALYLILSTTVVFYSLSGLTLRREVKMVFEALEHSLENGRVQVSRIVGRDTSQLNAQQIRQAALETLAENLNDGYVAPLFWFAVLGVPGMISYKMINTLDSMIGYKNDRYNHFGRFAAKIDDVVNYIPARITSVLMITVTGKFSCIRFILKYGRCHSSPNSGYPEAALAGILNCRFGGSNYYFGELVDKPFIGSTNRDLTTEDLHIGLNTNRRTEIMMVVSVIIYCSFIF
jgi:adenosylcobinamide-phosphate synthase